MIAFYVCLVSSIPGYFGRAASVIDGLLTEGVRSYSLVMLVRTFLPRHLVRHLYGTEPFHDYCRERGIAFDQKLGRAMSKADARRWANTVRALSEAKQAEVELDLAQVNELADPHTISLLTEAARGRALPPPPVAGDAARSLWFFLHHPELFREVLLAQEIAEVEAWRPVDVPAVKAAPGALLGRSAVLAENLRDFFDAGDGSGRYCVVDAFEIETGLCFVAHLSDRLQLLDVFTDTGEHTTRTARPSVTVLFVYDPTRGRILVRTRLRAHARILGLVRTFADAVLQSGLPDDCLRPTYRLDTLKHAFDPPADAPDMESARLKALHLAYPERVGRRRLKLETLTGDDRNAVFDLLRRHAGGGATLEELAVAYAELEVCLRVHGRRKPYVIRLWPDRTNLSHTPLGRRFHKCLSRWGLLAHAS